MKTQLIISDTIQDSRYDGRVRKFNRILSKKREEFNRAKKLEIANQAILATALLNQSCEAGNSMVRCENLNENLKSN